MGRKKKVQIEVSAESLEYVKGIIKAYPVMKKQCEEMENLRPMMLKRSGIQPSVFHMGAPPSVVQFKDPVETGDSHKSIMEYLTKKEQVYLLEHGIYTLDGLPHDVAVSLFLDRKSWETVMAELYISRMTLDRARNTAIRYIAAEADNYMLWKAKIMFG